MDGRSVDVVEEAELGRELAARRADAARWTVSVTDLLDPRAAFYRRFAPVPLPEARRRRRRAGTASHAQWLRHLAPPDRVEVWVRREGIVGVLDLFELDGPTELKTSGSVPPIESWVAERGAYFDQLGLYAALTDSERGRLVAVPLSDDGSSGAPRAVQCEFRDRSGLLEESVSRADRFRRALRRGDAADLPRCPWYHRGCPYRSAGACACTGDEPSDDRWVRDRLAAVREDVPTSDRWSRAMAAASTDPAPVLRGFSDLVYPRRAYFDRCRPAPPEEPVAIDPDSQSAYRDLGAAVDSGPAGERTQLPVPSGDPPGSVPLFRGGPFLLKTSRAAPPAEPFPASALPNHYRDELAFRCAALGTPEGWIFVAYLRARPPQASVRALRVRLTSLPEWIAELERRRRGLMTGTPQTDPREFPPCPGWRSPGCPYAAACGCAGSGA